MKARELLNRRVVVAEQAFAELGFGKSEPVSGSAQQRGQARPQYFFC